MSTVKVNLNGITELDFPTGVASASTAAGITTVSFDVTTQTAFVSEQPFGAVPGNTFTFSAPASFIFGFYAAGVFVPPSEYTVSGNTVILNTALSSGIPWIVYATGQPDTFDAANIIGLNEFNALFAESINTLDAMQFVFSQFQQKAPMSTPAADSASVVYNGKVYVIGGYGANATTYLTNTQIYDPVADSWSTGAAIPTGVWGAGCAAYNDKIYVFGGATLATGRSGTTLAYAYDTVGNSWSALTALPTVMADGVQAVTVGTKIYILWENLFYQYDPVGNSYTALTAAPGPGQVAWSACGYINVSSDDRIYFIGGNTTSGYTNVNYYYSVTNSLWSSAQATAPYTAHGMLKNAVYNGNIYYIGGYDGTLFYRTMYAYNPVSNTWSSSLYTLNEWRDGVAGGMIGGTMYVIGGRNAGDGFNPFGMVANEAYIFGSSAEPETFTKLQINYNQSSPTGNVRLGIYADNGSSGPGALIYDAGEVAIANGWTVISGLNIQLTPGTFYWLAFVQDTAEHISYTAGSPLNPSASAAHCFVSHTFGALPSTFPGSPTFITGSMYAMKLTVN